MSLSFKDSLIRIVTNTSRDENLTERVAYFNINDFILVIDDTGGDGLGGTIPCACIRLKDDQAIWVDHKTATEVLGIIETQLATMRDKLVKDSMQGKNKLHIVKPNQGNIIA